MELIRSDFGKIPKKMFNIICHLAEIQQHCGNICKSTMRKFTVSFRMRILLQCLDGADICDES